MNFSELLTRHASERPEAIALYDIDHAVSYIELQRGALRIAALLHAKGARPGDRLALWLPNCTAWLTIFLACARLGITVISMNTRFRSQEVGDLISRGQCRWLAMWPAFKGLPFAQILQNVDASLLSTLQGVLVVGEAPGTELVQGSAMFAYESMPAASLPDTVPEPAGSCHALVYTTSGTTSRPQLVVHDQETLVAHGANVAQVHGIVPSDAIL